MRRRLWITAFLTLPIAANADLPEPLKSYKNDYISCVNSVAGQALDAGNEVTESLLLGSCNTELASLKAVVPINMKALFSKQLKQELKANLYKKVTQSD